MREQDEWKSDKRQKIREKGGNVTNNNFKWNDFSTIMLTLFYFLDMGKDTRLILLFEFSSDIHCIIFCFLRFESLQLFCM